MSTNGIFENEQNQDLMIAEPGLDAGGRSNDLGELAQEYGQKIADKAVLARDFVAEKLNVAGEKIKDLQNRDFGEVAEQAKDYARKNPGQVIAAAAAAGFLLGILVKVGRRR
ncbi:MAG: hypothetical protein ABIZ95_17875 [Pyrinomonadaceae bacterium]